MHGIYTTTHTRTLLVLLMAHMKHHQQKTKTKEKKTQNSRWAFYYASHETNATCKCFDEEDNKHTKKKKKFSLRTWRNCKKQRQKQYKWNNKRRPIKSNKVYGEFWRVNGCVRTFVACLLLLIFGNKYNWWRLERLESKRRKSCTARVGGLKICVFCAHTYETQKKKTKKWLKVISMCLRRRVYSSF